MECEILEVGQIEKGNIFCDGKTYDSISIKIKFIDSGAPKGYSIINGCFTLKEDFISKYVDFTATRFKELGIFRVK